MIAREPIPADPVEAFRRFAAEHGYELPMRLEPGRIVRFATNGKRHDDAGWAVLFADGMGGVVGDWRSGASHVWHARRERELSPDELRKLRERAERARAEAEAQREREAQEAASRAAQIWAAASPAPADHAYLLSRGIGPHGARVYTGPRLVIGEMDCAGALVIALRDASGVIRSLEFIAANGEKRFLPGGRKAGAYYSLGTPDGTICVAEGLATGASVHEATGHAVAVAFDAGNLEPVARVLRAKFPKARIILAGDNDTSGTGQRAADEAARAVGGLVAIPSEVSADWNDVYRAHGADAVRRGIEAARAPHHDAGERPGPRPSAAVPPRAESSWPEPLADAAYHGLAGEIVRAIEPETEADPAALLVQTMIAFGALVGRGPHYRVEGDEHHAHLFGLLVGDTAKGRKGTSWGRVREIFSRVRGWPRVVDGLSSGEGLKWAVRDAIRRTERDKKTGERVEIETDPGVRDKRLLVVEAEFAQVLRQAQRTGNTLSATIRTAWDTGTLETLTKNDPVTATGAHISIIGHITADELRAELTATDAANGFANRFLYVCARRSKLLPFGGRALADADAASLAERIERAAERARKLGAVSMTDAAREIWVEVYPRLSAGHPGLLGAVTARAEAQAVRLALLYALLDEQPAIDAPHLLAAVAMAEYVEASASYIFGDALGDPVADEILRALRAAGAEGLTRTAIRDLLGRHESAERIGAALEVLRRHNLAVAETRATGGRPIEAWRCA